MEKTLDLSHLIRSISTFLQRQLTDLNAETLRESSQWAILLSYPLDAKKTHNQAVFPLSTTLAPTAQQQTMAQPVQFVVCKSQIGSLNCITVQTVAADSASFFVTHCHFSSFTFEDVYCICWCSLSVMLYPPPGGPRTAFLPHINYCSWHDHPKLKWPS